MSEIFSSISILNNTRTRVFLVRCSHPRTLRSLCSREKKWCCCTLEDSVYIYVCMRSQLPVRRAAAANMLCFSAERHITFMREWQADRHMYSPWTRVCISGRFVKKQKKKKEKKRPLSRASSFPGTSFSARLSREAVCTTPIAGPISYARATFVLSATACCVWVYPLCSANETCVFAVPFFALFCRNALRLAQKWRLQLIARQIQRTPRQTQGNARHNVRSCGGPGGASLPSNRPSR